MVVGCRGVVMRGILLIAIGRTAKIQHNVHRTLSPWAHHGKGVGSNVHRQQTGFGQRMVGTGAPITFPNNYAARLDL
jgi:hypothetical protein